MTLVVLCVSRLLLSSFLVFFFNDTATTEIYTLSLHDALPISHRRRPHRSASAEPWPIDCWVDARRCRADATGSPPGGVAAARHLPYRRACLLHSPSLRLEGQGVWGDEGPGHGSQRIHRLGAGPDAPGC